MQNFLTLLNKNFSNDDYCYFCEIYEKFKDKYESCGLNSIEFGINISKEILDNRLDINSIISGIIYPIYKIDSSIIDDDIFGDDDLNDVFDEEFDDEMFGDGEDDFDDDF